MIGLSNVDNTSDLNKPISTATQSALNLKMNTDDGYLKIAEGDNYILEIKPGIRISGNTVTEELKFQYYDLDDTTWRDLFYGKWDELNDKPILFCNNLQAISGSVTTFNNDITISGNLTATSILGGALTQIQNLISSSTYSQSQIDSALNLKQNNLLNGTIPANTARVLVPGGSKIRSVNGDSSITVVETDDAYLTLSVNSATVNKSFVGLSNADNTSDANKPISTAQQTALNLKADITYVDNGLNDKQDVLLFAAPTNGFSLYKTGSIVKGLKATAPLTITDDVGGNSALELGLNSTAYMAKSAAGSITYCDFNSKARIAWDDTNNKFQFQYFDDEGATATDGWGSLLEAYILTETNTIGIVSGIVTCDSVSVFNNVTSSGIITNSLQANGDPQVTINDNLDIAGVLNVTHGSAVMETYDNGDGLIMTSTLTTKSIGIKSGSGNYSSGAWIKVFSSSASPVLIRPNTNGVQLTDGATAWSSYSDKKLKDNIESLTDSLNKIVEIQPCKYTWKNDYKKKKCIGIMAQDVQKVLPEAVDEIYDEETKESLLGVRYTDLIPLLIGCIQELKARVEILEKK